MNGAIPISKEAQEALDRTSKLQAQIASLEAMDHADTGKIIATFKQELVKLKPKLPKAHQGLEDQAQYWKRSEKPGKIKPQKRKC